MNILKHVSQGTTRIKQRKNALVLTERVSSGTSRIIEQPPSQGCALTTLVRREHGSPRPKQSKTRVEQVGLGSLQPYPCALLQDWVELF